jgi:beta-galactosidase
VENEYGSFGDDRAYMEQIHHLLVDAGFTKAQLYTADEPEEMVKGSLPELPIGINFTGSKTGAAQKAFTALKLARPGGPFFSSELCDGWFDHWGGKHTRTDPKNEAGNLEWILNQGYSVSLYMFEGGTSFGWMNGANSNGTNYEPDVTSYDYDAPLDESGRPTTKYYLFRQTIAKATGISPPPVPAVAPSITVPEFKLPQTVSLWDALPQPVHSEQPLTMEDLDQSYGYILYRTELKGPVAGDLTLDRLHDYAQVYLDGQLIATIDRRLGEDHFAIDVKAEHARLDILVENTGRVNFSSAIRGERKGITHRITLAGTPLTGWSIYPLPMGDPAKLPYTTTPCNDTCFYRGTFKVKELGDTFLDTSAFTKGEVWLNGHSLGRVWDIGPQKTLYVPSSWLRVGENEVIVFNLKGPLLRSLIGRATPVLESPTDARQKSF